MIHLLDSHLDRFAKANLLVLGDLILDRYTWGDAERVSPEAPVLVLAADADELRPGGAASVAALLRGLEAHVTLAGVVGNDDAGQSLRQLLDEVQVDRRLVLVDPARPTTSKHRFIGRAAARHPHQILRVDRECREPLSGEQEDELAGAVVARLDDHQAVLVSDYAKGVCTPSLLARVLAAARARRLPVLVDPARLSDYARYRGATVLKPNRVEAELASGRTIVRPEDAMAAGQELCRQCQADAAVITLDREGMALVEADGAGRLIAGRSRTVYDITGAGDMALAVLGLCQAGRMPLVESVELANVAAGLEVERLGVAPVTRAELQAAAILADAPSRTKLVQLEEMAVLAEAYRSAGRTVVFTNGCFDLLHVGHAAYLQESARLGDVLVVAVNSDRSVRALKGPGRPIIGEHDRAALVAALACVDHVLIFDDPTPHELLHRLRPDVLVKGGTYAPQEIIGREVVEAYGGRVRVTGAVPGISTSSILRSLHGGSCQHTYSAEVAQF